MSIFLFSCAIFFEISIFYAIANSHPFYIGGQKEKGKMEMCLELFPDYVRHCARNMHILMKKDKFCADYSKSCLEFGQGANEESWQKQKQEEIPSEEATMENEEGENENDYQNEEEDQQTSPPPSTTTQIAQNETTTNLEPDDLPPLDFSLRRPPPSPSQRFSRQYNSNFCCRFRERFDCLCHQDHQNIGSYGAAFCPTYSERCSMPLPDWKKNRKNAGDGEGCCGESTNKPERMILTCKQIKLTC